MPALAPVFTAIAGYMGTEIAILGGLKVGTVMAISLAAGSMVYSQAQARKMEKKARAAMLANQGMTITSRDSAAQRRIIYGEMRIGGTIVFLHSTGDRNKYLHMVVTLAGHEVESIGDIYLDDVLVPLDAAGLASSGKFSGKVRVKKFLGTADQAASADLIAETTNWTSAHRLRGIAYLYVRLAYDAETFSGIPNISAVVKGRKVYDPRSSSTAWSDNPALCLRDYLTNADYGLGAATDEIDDASIIAKANICDESVTVAGGTEKRYTVNGAITRDTTPADVLNSLTDTCAGMLIYTGGFWSLAGCAYETPSRNFSWNDLRGEIAFQTGDSRRDTCNAVKGTYVSPKNLWQSSDYPPVKNATYYAQDGNERIWRELDLPLTNSSAMAQRLAKIELERARQDITVKLQVKLQGLTVRAGDVVTLTLDRYGWTAKPFEVVGWKFITESSGGDDDAPILGVDLELRETAPAVWDWSSGEETTVDIAPDTTLPDWRSVGVPRSLAVASTATLEADGTLVASITATWLEPLDNFVVSGGQIEVEYQIDGAPTWTPGPVIAGSQISAVIVPVSSGQSYRLRVRSVNNLGVRSVWVVSVPVAAAGDITPPSAPTAVVASGLYKGARVVWTPPAATDLAYVEIYEAAAATPAPDAGTAGTARVYGTDYVRGDLAAGVVRWYWVRAVDASANKSAWVAAGSATAQAIDTTGIFPITSTQIADDSISTPKLQAGSITAAKVGTNEIIATSANLANAVVTTAKIADLAVDSAKIADLAVTNAKIAALDVAKLTAGTISSKVIEIGGGTDGVIQSTGFVAGSSGWRIRGNGDAEFNTVTIRVSDSVSATGSNSVGNDGTATVATTPSKTWLARLVNVSFAATFANSSGAATVWDITMRIKVGSAILAERTIRYTVSGGAIRPILSIAEPVSAGDRQYTAEVFASVWSGGSTPPAYVLGISSAIIQAEQLVK